MDNISTAGTFGSFYLKFTISLLLPFSEMLEQVAVAVYVLYISMTLA